MYWLLLLIIIILIAIFYYGKSGSAEIVPNKTTLSPAHIPLANTDFESFVSKRKLKCRLIYIGGAKCVGKSKLAEMLVKKGFKVIENKKNEHRDKNPRELRREIKIKTNERLAKDYKKEAAERKYVITGTYSDDELRMIFKGIGVNRNFVYLFVIPDGTAAAWSKVSGQPKEDYEKLEKESKTMLNSAKKYRMYLVKNKF